MILKIALKPNDIAGNRYSENHVYYILKKSYIKPYIELETSDALKNTKESLVDQIKTPAFSAVFSFARLYIKST